MTDQMFVFLCSDLKKHAHDYRRGELHDVEERKFEEHLSACAKCQDYYARLEGLLDAAAVHEAPQIRDRDEMFMNIIAKAREGEPADRDDLFEQISARIHEPEAIPEVAAAALALVGEGEEQFEAANDEIRRGPVLLYVTAALAAGVLIGFGLRTIYTTPDAPKPSEVGAIAKAETVDVAEPEPEPEPEALVASVSLAELRPQPSPVGIEDVHVFGSDDAAWGLKAQGAGRTMNVESGTVLVEFVPGKRSALQVVGAGFEVEVTGTIFYVSADPTKVGVVEGSVLVRREEGEAVALTPGEEWSPSDGKQQAKPTVREDAERHVNVEGHADALRAARGESKREEPPRPKLSKEVARTPRAELRASAEEALHEGRYAVAAQFYERMVDELPATQPENASLRLDLARIYLRHLGQERRAIGHLRRFVDDRPSDPLTPVARDELCRIAGAIGARERGCPQ